MCPLFIHRRAVQKFPEWDFQTEPKVNELIAQEVGNGEASEKHREFSSGWAPESSSEAHEFGLNFDPISKSPLKGAAPNNY